MKDGKAADRVFFREMLDLDNLMSTLELLEDFSEGGNSVEELPRKAAQ